MRAWAVGARAALGEAGLLAASLALMWAQAVQADAPGVPVVPVVPVQDATATPAPAHEVINKKRAAPPKLKPVVVAGVRYTELRGGRGQGLSQSGGQVRAVNEATGEELWVVQVYEAGGDPDMEADKRDVFITEMRPDARKKHLLIRNERGQRFSIALDTRQVKVLSPAK